MTAPGTSAHRLGYIPALDGIRGIAVLAVLAYHAGFDGLSGGFLGVSAFFTLSGFLITTLLLREHDSTGEIVLWDFWKRRARRLLPALLLTIGGVAAFAATVANTAQAQAVRDDGPWAVLYLANWRFVVDGQSYADLFRSDETNPLLHLWSLAIEEQFYLVMPLLVTVLLARGSRILGLSLVGLLGLSVASTVTLALTGSDSSRIYYGTDTRASEVLIGAFLGWMVHRTAIETVPSSRRSTAAAVAALALLGVMWTSTDETTLWLHRGGFTLHALAVAVVILAAIRPGRMARLLAWRPLAALGMISYGLYLFHWPIYLWLTPDRMRMDGPSLFAVRLLVTFGAAFVSLILIERPIRRGARAWRRPVVAIGAVTAALVSVIALPAAGSQTQVVLEPLHTQAISRPAAPTIMLVGDSVMITLGRGFEHWADDTGSATVINAANLGCPVGRGGRQRLHGESFDTFDHCDAWEEEWTELLDTYEPDLVLMLSGAWDLKDRQLPGWDDWQHSGDPEFDAWLAGEYSEAVDLLASRGAAVGVFRPACLQREDVNGESIEIDEFDPERLPALHSEVIDPLERSAGAVVLDLDRLLCPDGRNQQRWPGVSGDVRPDGVHFSEAGARAMADYWAPLVLALATI